MAIDERWIVGLGEVLWDVFPDQVRFGGAPANFACHARAMGGRVAMVSAVGPVTDPLADAAIETLGQHGVDTQRIGRNSHETGRVTVTLDSDGHASYLFSESPAWDFISWSDELGALAEDSQCVCFGTLAQRHEESRRTIRRFLAHMPADSWRIFDVNLRRNFWNESTIIRSLQLANVLKLNGDELTVVAQACGVTSRGTDALKAILEQFDLRLVAYTDGKHGATLVNDNEVNFCPAPKVKVADTVGAGDSFTAAMSLGLLQDWTLEHVNRQAVQVAAYVCTQPGATPTLPEDIVQQFVQR